MRHLSVLLLLALGAVVLGGYTTNQAYTAISSVLTPNLNDPCYIDVTENITLVFYDTAKTSYVTRFIPDRIAGSDTAVVRSLSIKSITDGVLVRDTFASGYDKNLQGYVIKQTVYNPNRVSSATFILQYTVNVLGAVNRIDAMHWFFDKTPENVQTRRVTVNFPPAYLPKDFDESQMRFGQSPTLYMEQYDMVTSATSSYLEQRNYNQISYITLSYPSPRSNECTKSDEPVAYEGPSASAIIGAVFGAFFGSMILFGAGVAGCCALYWCTSPERRLSKFKRMYDE